MEQLEINRQEPILIEIEEKDRIISHLMIFEFKLKIRLTPKEIIMDGDIEQTVFEAEHNFID